MWWPGDGMMGEQNRWPGTRKCSGEVIEWFFGGEMLRIVFVLLVSTRTRISSGEAMWWVPKTFQEYPSAYEFFFWCFSSIFSVSVDMLVLVSLFVFVLDDFVLIPPFLI